MGSSRFLQYVVCTARAERHLPLFMSYRSPASWRTSPNAGERSLRSFPTARTVVLRVSARCASATVIWIAFASFPLLVMTLRGDARRRVPAGLERRLRHPAALAVSARASRHHH